MKPEEIKLRRYYIYPATGIAVMAHTVKSGVIQLYPLNPNHDIGAGNGLPIPATETNVKHLIPGYTLPKQQIT